MIRSGTAAWASCGTSISMKRQFGPSLDLARTRLGSIEASFGLV
jgi:hypothetical protein